jgi:A/G-specific adenine glycosylase
MEDFSEALRRWFRSAARDLPWRKTRDPYAILVSELMLQQTQVATVIGYYRRWLNRFPDVSSLAAADEPIVLRMWEGLGYYARARNLHRAARVIVEKHAGKFPRTLEEIRALPGVGPYTAGAVASFAFGVRTPIVDANIARVVARLHNTREPIDTTAGHRLTWHHADVLLPAGRAAARQHNAALMELGAILCKSGEPPCRLCPVKQWCKAIDPINLPVKRARRATVSVEEHCGWIVDRGRVLLETSVGPRARGLWRLPQLKSAPRRVPLHEAEYPFTYHRVRLRVYRAVAPRRALPNHRWFEIEEIAGTAMTSPHRRALVEILGQIERSPRTMRCQFPRLSPRPHES